MKHVCCCFNLGGKTTLSLQIIRTADTIKHVDMKEKIRAPQIYEKTSRNQALEPESHQNDKHLICAPSKIHRAILKIDEERTSKKWTR